MNRSGMLVVLSSPSGGGKTTLRTRLCELMPSLRYSISLTTRRPRPREVNGIDYIYVSEAEFLERRERGEFIEWALVHGNYYGTPFPHVKEMLEDGHDVVLDIDTQGAESIRQKIPQAILIFILPPSLASLADRLHQREHGEQENMIKERLSVATKEISHLPSYDYLVVNQDIELATNILKSILEAEKWSTNRFDLEQVMNSDDFSYLLDELEK